jgi:hypothetical protein
VYAAALGLCPRCGKLVSRQGPLELRAHGTSPGLDRQRAPLRVGVTDTHRDRAVDGQVALPERDAIVGKVRRPRHQELPLALDGVRRIVSPGRLLMLLALFQLGQRGQLGDSTGRQFRALVDRALPVGEHPAREGPRCLGVDRGSQSECSSAQVGLLRAGETMCVRDRLGAAVVVGVVGETPDEDGEVMVVAERLGQVVEALDRPVEHAWRRPPQEPNVVPEVLGRLAPLVQVIVGRLGQRPAVRPPAAPKRGFESGTERVVAVCEVPAADLGAALGQ